MFLESGADNQEEQAVVWWLVVMFVGLFQAYIQLRTELLLGLYDFYLQC